MQSECGDIRSSQYRNAGNVGRIAPVRRRTTLALLLSATTLVAGCAHDRVIVAENKACQLDLVDLSVDAINKPSKAEGGVQPLVAGPPPATLDDLVAQALSTPAPPAPGGFGPASAKPPPIENLILSGGGKWGSFGAGFMHAYGNRKEDGRKIGLPEYRVITGVSTGALQSPFIFVGNVPVPKEAASRRYNKENDTLLHADDAQPTGLPGGRTYLDDLPLAYRISRSESVVDVYISRPSNPTAFDGITILHRGTGSHLRGLRERLQTLIDDNMLATIAEAAGDDPKTGRRLFVGLVDMDDGKPYAVNMTALVAGWKNKPQPERDLARNCFHDLLIASSSEPLVARPVFINRKLANGDVLPTRMYMDGGMRHGVFLREVVNPAARARALDKLKQDGTPPPKIVTTVIINGRLTTKDKTEPDVATGKIDEKWLKEWSILGLARRTQEIFTDQVYQMSTERVRLDAEKMGDVRLLAARGYQDHSYKPTADDPQQGAAQKCGWWQDNEKDEGFPPMFMRCLTSFGSATAIARDGKPNWLFPDGDDKQAANKPAAASEMAATADTSVNAK